MARLIRGIHQSLAYSVVRSGRIRSVHRTRADASRESQEGDAVQEEPVLTDGKWYVTIRALTVDAEGAGFAIQQKLASGSWRQRVEAQRFFWEHRMNRQRYFVMVISSPAGMPSPLSNEDGSVRLFDTEVAASEALSMNALAECFGYEIYPWLHGGTE